MSPAQSIQITQNLPYQETRIFYAKTLSDARLLIIVLARSAEHEENSIPQIYKVKTLQPDNTWKEWKDNQERKLTDPDAIIVEFSQENPPPEGSSWLVWVECLPQIIKVSSAKAGEKPKGFFIPGQEPCWHFNHVQQWVYQIPTDLPSDI